MSDRSELEMSSVEAQLCVLYAEKQRLEEELGSSQADEIVALVDELGARIADLEQEARSAAPLDEVDTLRIRVAELIAERESFLLSVDADDLEAARAKLTTLQSQRPEPTAAMSNKNYDAMKAIDSAIDMASEVSNDCSSSSDAATVAKDLRTLAEQLGHVFSSTKVTYSGRLNGAQWKLECHNG
jgi:predicted  nucleic acid-binding Zn-ribbon protein